MNLEARIDAFARLGDQIEEYLNGNEISNARGEIGAVIEMQEIENPWFTRENIRRALSGIRAMLKRESLLPWLAKYANLTEKEKLFPVAIIMAGNIPAVGFHDLLCVLISGNNALIKLSRRDNLLIPYLVKLLNRIEPEFSSRVSFESGVLKNFRGIIATGSSNTGRYFEYYAGKYPHIIRKNRTSIAFLNGNESDTELEKLSTDIFSYFGMGCRNVSKLFLPIGYKPADLFLQNSEFKKIIHHTKYFNNYEYQKSLFTIEKKSVIDTGYFLLQQSDSFAAPISVVFYDHYQSYQDFLNKILDKKDELQCIASSNFLPNMNTIPFGETQFPGPGDYADQIDTLNFLLNL